MVLLKYYNVMCLVRVTVRVRVCVDFRDSLPFVNSMVPSWTKAISRLTVVTATFKFPAENL